MSKSADEASRDRVAGIWEQFRRDAERQLEQKPDGQAGKAPDLSGLPDDVYIIGEGGLDIDGLMKIAFGGEHQCDPEVMALVKDYMESMVAPLTATSAREIEGNEAVRRLGAQFEQLEYGEDYRTLAPAAALTLGLIWNTIATAMDANVLDYADDIRGQPGAHIHGHLRYIMTLSYMVGQIVERRKHEGGSGVEDEQTE
jgi:hypothetical protein